MAKYSIEDSTLTGIADAIREKNGTTENISPTDMAAAILAISSGDGGGLKYEIGQFTVASDTQSTTVHHNLGETPYFMMVWTDHWAGLTADTPSNYTTGTNVGFVFARGITGMVQRLTSAASHDKELQNFYVMGAGEYRVNMLVGTSSSYGITTYPTDTTLYIGRAAGNYYWRSGVTYNYFIAAPWWNTRE